MTTPIIESAEEEAQITAFLKSVEGYSDTVADRIGNFKGMFYGNDGTGKTIAGIALLNHIVPADKTILLIDTADNSLSLNNHPVLRSRVKRIPYRNMPWVRAMITTIKNRIPPFDNIGGIQFDEYSSIADTALAAILEYQEELNPARPKDDATWPDYKMLLRQMRNLQTALNGLEGVHTTFITHFRTDKQAFGKVMEAPNFVPSTGLEIRRPMHLIARVVVDDEGKRTFQLQPDSEHLAKCKIGGLGRSATVEDLITKTGEWINGKIETVEKTEIVTANDSTNTNDTDWNDI